MDLNELKPELGRWGRLGRTFVSLVFTEQCTHRLSSGGKCRKECGGQRNDEDEDEHWSKDHGISRRNAIQQIHPQPAGNRPAKDAKDFSTCGHDNRFRNTLEGEPTSTSAQGKFNREFPSARRNVLCDALLSARRRAVLYLPEPGVQPFPNP
jgi:hypothetical protein